MIVGKKVIQFIKINIMKIGQLIDIRQNFDTSIKNELLRMDVFFQNHLWDGFISNDDFEAIQALIDKIKKMVLKGLNLVN